MKGLAEGRQNRELLDQLSNQNQFQQFGRLDAIEDSLGVFRRFEGEQCSHIRGVMGPKTL
jgi:hypothetical protein